MKYADKKLKISIFAVFMLILAGQSAFAGVFNKNLTAEEQKTLDKGEVLIKNIAYQKNMSLNKDFNADCAALTDEIKQLNPKYLAEIIQIKPYKGNENLPQILTELLYNVSDYVGIYSRHGIRVYP